MPASPASAPSRGPSPWVLIYRVPGAARWAWRIGFPAVDAVQIAVSHKIPSAFAVWESLTRPLTDALAHVIVGIRQIDAAMQARGLATEAASLTNAIALNWLLLAIFLASGAIGIGLKFHRNGSVLAQTIEDAFAARGKSSEDVPLALGILFALALAYWLVGTDFVVAGLTYNRRYNEAGVMLSSGSFVLVAEFLCSYVTLSFVRRYLPKRT